MRSHAIAPVLALAALVGLGSAGCSKQLKNTVIANQIPVVRLTWAPLDTTSANFYVYKMNWVGYDPDGRVVRFEYVVDPPTAKGAVINWTSTTKNEETIKFVAAEPESAFWKKAKPRTRGFHVFAVRAVDNLGAVSEPVKRAFYARGVAPIVWIVAPVPSDLLSPRVTPAVRIRWSGKDFIDDNGVAFEKPLKYKYKLFKRNDPGVDWDVWFGDPDSLRRQVAPAFAGWDSTGPDTAEVQFTNLTTKSEYLFVVVAFGRSGAYSPIFDYFSNMLRMAVGLAGELGPKITLFNSFFSYTYASGGFSLDFSRAIQLQVPAGRPGVDPPLTFNWTAEPPEGSIMKRYRWVLDLQSLDDETPRSNQNDWYHWSPWGGATSTSVGPFAGAGGDTGEVHNFYLEAEDINGLVSLGWVQFRVYRPTFDKDLLIVNDTRFMADQVSKDQVEGRTDSLRAPTGVWPTRAELDTFLFAVGGMRWKMTPPPQDRLSPTGIFSGYSFDTLGTRYGRIVPTVPLGLLGQYRHVVWMTDQKAVGWENAPNSRMQPMTTLVYMSGRNRQNTLATWVGQGGKLWALGSGFGTATNSPWNNLANDDNQTRTYRFDGSLPDLTPGRFMFDLAHWRSEFRVLGPVSVQFSRYDQPDPTVRPPLPKSYWTGGKFTDPEVDYTLLPTTLQPRDPATDPIWPNRSLADFYVNNQDYSGNGVNLEFISREHYMLEQIPVPSATNPDSTVERSTLDSLYLAYGSYTQMLQSGSGQGVNTVMTYYHGQENAPLVFSGMSIWDFRRQDCLGLVDFVLGRLWHLSKSTLYTAPRAVAPSLARRTAVPTPQTPRRLPGSVRQPVGTSTFQRWR